MAGHVIAEKGRAPELAILLIEDEHYLRLAGQRLLGLIGYQVVTVADGQEALELLSSGDVEVDLVLSDVVMPNLSGKDLHKALQKLPDAPPRFCSRAGPVRVICRASICSIHRCPW